jgi:adenylate cyclase
VLPLTASLVVNVLVILVGLYGQFRYFVMQGERGAFLGRFLSTQVAELVRNDGLAAVMEPGEREVTVVACDLRGFTSYAEAVPSQAVIDLLNEYYEAVGVAVAEVAGTVKDYAGDGVLVIIGAPVARDDHATAGLALARRLHEVVTPVRKHWGTGPHPLGLGIGVASGLVAVGAVGSSSRLEYTAVGTAVNLGSRLCSAAGEGETLVDQSTVDLTGVDGLSSRGSMPIKGLSADHAVYTLEAQPK